MAKINSKAKGNRFELEMAKLFSELFHGEFRRTPSSGAYTGGTNRAKTENLRDDAKEILAGDLIAPKFFPFLIELKHYANDPAFHKIVQGEDKTLDRWITQNDCDAAFVDKESLIIFRINRKGDYVVMQRNSQFITDNLATIGPFIVYKDKIIMSLDMFANAISLNSIIDMISNPTPVN